MLKTIAFATATMLSVAGTALAQTPPSHDPAKVTSGTYDVEPNHTIAAFSVDHMGFTTYYGTFSGLSGTLVLDAKSPKASKLDVTIPVASVQTTSPKLMEELRSADWLDAGAYPDMHFVSTKVTVTGAGKATVLGNLTLHGVTKPVSLAATFHGAGLNILNKKYTVGFDAVGHLKRSEFGVKKYVPLIGDDVTLILTGAFQKQG
jgi:polyisoprenoid-binding protein YceI